MPKVFIVEKPKNNIDVSKAEDFGEIIYLFNQNERRLGVFECMTFGLDVINKINEKGGFQLNDSFLTAGAQIPVAIAFAAIISKWPNVLVLLYNAKQDMYVQRRIVSSRWRTKDD